jgi:predicted extracellular nuclease
LEPREAGDLKLSSGEHHNFENLTIYDLQKGEQAGFKIPSGLKVTVKNVSVTAVVADSSGKPGLIVQDPQGGEFSGIYLYNAKYDASIKVGTIITFTGNYSEYYGLTEVGYATIQKVKDGEPLEPLVISPETLVTGEFCAGADADGAKRPYEGVLVKVENVTVTNTSLGNGEWEVSGGLRIDDAFYVYKPTKDEAFDSIIGLGWFSFGNCKLEPRTKDDLIKP